MSKLFVDGISDRRGFKDESHSLLQIVGDGLILVVVILTAKVGVIETDAGPHLKG